MRLPLVFVVAMVAAAVSSGEPTRTVGRVVGISDGDTFTVLVDGRQVRVRLSQVDAPERGQPWANRAREALGGLVFRKEVVLEEDGLDSYDRLLARVTVNGVDVGSELVAMGHAWAFRRYLKDERLLELETAARMAGRGLWGLTERAIPPWDWRRGERAPVYMPADGEPRCGTKRTCREMRDCDEATWYLVECGLDRIDGDGDGVPCESLCR